MSTLRTDIVLTMPFLRILKRYPRRPIPDSLRPAITRIVAAMDQSATLEATVVTEWCEKQLRRIA